MEAQAVWFASPGLVEMRSEHVPEPGPTEVLVEADFSLISSGTEMLAYRGEFASATEAGLDRPGRAGTFPFPLKYGYQVVGRVVDKGVDAPLEIGQRVFAVHPHQTRFVLPTDAAVTRGKQMLHPIPDALTSARATYSNLFGVALNAVLDCPVRVGDCVAISGLGVVGVFLAHLVRESAATLILIDPRADRRSAAAGVGADAVVAPEEAASAIDALSEGRGTDLHFEASGAPAALQTAIRASGQDASVVVVSYYGRRKVELILSPEFHFRRLKLISSQAGAINPALVPRWPMTRRVRVAMDRLASLDLELDPQRFAFLDAQSAYAAVDAGIDDTQGVLLEYRTDSPAAQAPTGFAPPFDPEEAE